MRWMLAPGSSASTLAAARRMRPSLSRASARRGRGTPISVTSLAQIYLYRARVNTIPTSDGGLLAINIFTVRPEDQQALVDCIRDAGDPADVPGLRSMHLLRSADGTRVINQMHWESEAAFAAATSGDPV